MSTNKSFSARLSLTIVLVSSIIFILGIGVAAVSSHKLIAEEAMKSAEHVRDAAILDIEKTLKEVEVAVSSEAWVVEEKLASKDYLYHITRRLVEENLHIVGSAIAFKPLYYPGEYFFSPYSYIDEGSGEILSKQLGSNQYNYFYMDWYQIPFLTGKPCWTEPYVDEGGAGYLMSTYSFPIKDRNGEVYAIMTADISLDWLAEITSSIKPYPSSYVVLVSKCGHFINSVSDGVKYGETVFSTENYVKSDRSVSDLHEISMKMMSGESGMMRYSIGNKLAFVVFGPISNGWRLNITCDYREVLASTSTMHLVLTLVGLFGILILFLFCYSTIRKLTKPLTEFSRSALSIAKGNFNTELPEIKYDDEIKQLRNSFDFMQHSLTSYMENLKETTAINERLGSELNIANRIQMSMLSKDFPDNDKVKLHAFVKPAKEVGGDLYDFFIVGNMLYFAVGDVSGKGVPASLFMAITRAAYRMICKQGLPMDEVVYRINESVSTMNDNGMFITFFAGSINLETGDFQYCNAGHNPIIVVSPDGTPSYLKVIPNLPLGLFPDFKYQLQSGRIEKGSRLLLFTDGVTEAERADKEQYGEDRLLAWAGSEVLKKGIEADVACNELYADVTAFTAGNEQNDDITIMTIDIK